MGRIDGWIRDLSDRLACRCEKSAQDVVVEWYVAISKKDGKKVADKAFRLRAMILEVYDAGRRDGKKDGGITIEHVDRVEEIMAEKNVNVDASGQGVIVNIAEYMSGITNTVNQNIGQSEAPDDVKKLLKQLTEQIATAGPKVDAAKAKQLGDDVTAISNEIARKEPRKKWYELSLGGIKEAAQAIGEVGKPIVQTAVQLASVLGVALG